MRTLKNITKLLLILTLMTAVASVVASPPHPDLLEASKASKSLTYITSNIDKMHAKGICTPATVPQELVKNTASSKGAAITGDFKVLALLVNFSDHGSSVNATFFDSLIYDSVSSTVRDYYKEISYDQLDIISVNLPSSLGWQTAPQPYTFYVNGENGTGAYPNNSQKLVEDLVNLVDPQVDFSNYDNDGDGFVDVLLIIHSGSGGEYSGDVNDIWSHKWSTLTPMLRDSVYIFNYTVQPEYWNTAGDMTIGVFAHELGHAFGLPDLYDTDYDSYGIGAWGLMAFGSWRGPGNDGSSPSHPCAWSKIQMGFLTATNIETNISSTTIINIEENQVAYRLWNAGAANSEYFLIENRQKIGYDSYLPGEGLLIWHIDESKTNNDQQWFTGEDSTNHYLVALKQADGLYEIEQDIDLGDAADPFPGTGSNTTFSPFTSPNSNSYLDGETFVSVGNIVVSGGNIIADLTVGIAAGIGDDDELDIPNSVNLSQNYPNPFNPSTNISFTLNAGSHATLEVFNLLGQKIATLLDEYLPMGESTVAWDTTDDSGTQVASGIYLYRLQVGSQSSAKKMVLIR